MVHTCTLSSLQRNKNVNIIMDDTVSLKHPLDYIKCEIVFEPVRSINTEL